MGCQVVGVEFQVFGPGGLGGLEYRVVGSFVSGFAGRHFGFNCLATVGSAVGGCQN